MGVKIFRNDNWSRIKSGVIYRRDVMGLDPDGDRELIGYLIAHAPEPSRLSMIKYASEKYGMDEMPEPRVNTDDPEDASEFADRSKAFPHKIDENDLAYRLFTGHGFLWGGVWEDENDYMHFEKPWEDMEEEEDLSLYDE